MFARSISQLTMRAAYRMGAKSGAAKILTPKVSTLRSMSTIVSIEEAKKQVATYREMPNDLLLTMAALGDQDAREERLIREIMAKDNVDWKAAQPTFMKILASNRSGLFVATLPYKIGIFSAVSAGFLSFPMIFDINTVMWFNELYVTTDVPEAKDLETPLEVGGWAWNWMEPPLGQISFFLLCMQYARAQMENLGIKPFTSWYKAKRAERLTREFPKYNAHIIEEFSQGDPLTGGASKDHGLK